jgi:iron complex outermembrane receptor protein
VALYGEYDLPFVQGLTFNGGLRYESEQFIDNENVANREADSWVEVDLGARYDFEVAEVPLTARLFLDNAFDEGYWGVNEFGGLQLSTPRKIGMSLTADF